MFLSSCLGLFKRWERGKWQIFTKVIWPCRIAASYVLSNFLLYCEFNVFLKAKMWGYACKCMHIEACPAYPPLRGMTAWCTGRSPNYWTLINLVNCQSHKKLKQNYRSHGVLDVKTKNIKIPLFDTIENEYIPNSYAEIILKDIVCWMWWGKVILTTCLTA